MALLRDLTIPLHANVLPQKAQSGDKNKFSLVDTERNTQPSFVEQLKDLDHVFAGVGKRKERHRANIFAAKANGRAMDQRTDEVVHEGLHSKSKG